MYNANKEQLSAYNGVFATWTSVNSARPSHVNIKRAPNLSAGSGGVHPCDLSVSKSSARSTSLQSLQGTSACFSLLL